MADPLYTHPVILNLEAAAERKDTPNHLNVNHSFTDEIDQWPGAQSARADHSVDIFDISQDGMVQFRGCRAAAEASKEQPSIEELGEGQTRLILASSECPYYSGINSKSTEHAVWRPGMLVYDDSKPEPVNQSSSNNLGAFDSWSLQRLWNPSTHGYGCPVYLQTNTFEALLRNLSSIEETALVYRQILFFSRYTVELWCTFASAQTEFLSNDRAESEIDTVKTMRKPEIDACSNLPVSKSPNIFSLQRLYASTS